MYQASKLQVLGWVVLPCYIGLGCLPQGEQQAGTGRRFTGEESCAALVGGRMVGLMHSQMGGGGHRASLAEKYRQHTGQAHRRLGQITPFIGNLGSSFEFIYQRHGSGYTQTRINFKLKWKT